MVTKMAISLEHRAVPPEREKTPRKPRKVMPKGRGIHIQINFGGEVAERGRKIVDLETDNKVVARRSTPPPAPEKDEQERPTYTPNPDENKALRFQKLIEQSARPIDEVDQDDMPTHQPPGFKKPRTETAKEEKLLSRDSDVSRLTTSFAPPPPIPSAVREENIATEVRDNVVPIAVAEGWVPPSKREKEKKRPSINPNGKGWSLEETVRDSLVMPHNLCGPGSR